MEELTAAVKAIDLDGLLWGGSQLVAIGFGIKKLQINCVVEDDKVKFTYGNTLPSATCSYILFYRSVLMILLTRSRNWRTLSNPLMLLLCKRFKFVYASIHVFVLNKRKKYSFKKNSIYACF
jgi:hypothetical protein